VTRVEIARETYGAYELGDRSLVERHLAPGFRSTTTDGQRFRNTEVLTFAGDQIIRAEVYFGWNLE
jgi:hypothetical protein